MVVIYIKCFQLFVDNKCTVFNLLSIWNINYYCSTDCIITVCAFHTYKTLDS